MQFIRENVLPEQIGGWKTPGPSRPLIVEFSPNCEGVQALEFLLEEVMHKPCQVVIHVQDLPGEAPANYYTKRIKLRAGKMQRFKFPVLSKFSWVELWSPDGEILLRELNTLRVVAPVEEWEVAAPTSSTIVAPRSRVSYTPSGFEVLSKHLEFGCPVYATMLRPLDANTAYQLDCFTDSICKMQNPQGLFDDFTGYWRQVFLEADFSPAVFVFQLDSRDERSGLLRCNVKLLANYAKPVENLSRPNVWNVKTN